MRKNDIIIFASAIITALSLVAATNVYAQQQQQPPSQAQLPNTALPTGAIPIVAPNQLPKGLQNIPPLSQAQIQSALADAKAQAPYALAMAKEVTARLGTDTSAAHLAQILKQMTAEGKINCPTPFVNPGHCIMRPPNVPLPFPAR